MGSWAGGLSAVDGDPVHDRLLLGVLGGRAGPGRTSRHPVCWRSSVPPRPGCEAGCASAGAWEQHRQRPRALSGAAASWLCAGWAGLDAPGVRDMVSGAAGLGLHSGYTPSGLGRLSPLSLSVLIRTAWPMMAAPVSELCRDPRSALSACAASSWALRSRLS